MPTTGDTQETGLTLKDCETLQISGGLRRHLLHVFKQFWQTLTTDQLADVYFPH